MKRSQSRSARKQRKRALLRDYKFRLGCATCASFTNLEFHHLDPTTKVEGISRMVSNDRSMEAIFEEVKKCEVLCQRCHEYIHERRKE